MIGTPSDDLAEQFRVRLLVEADDERPALPHRRRPQVPRRPQQQLPERLAVGLLGAEIDVDHALALGHVEQVDVLQQPQRRVPLDGRLLGVGLGGDLDLPLRKEPLRLGAGLSAGPVVAPVDSDRAARHVRPPRNPVIAGRSRRREPCGPEWSATESS